MQNFTVTLTFHRNITVRADGIDEAREHVWATENNGADELVEVRLTDERHFSAENATR